MHGSKDIFYSITATPLVGNGSYMEILPCAELLPYIRCFWRKDVKTERESLIQTQQASLVIPDACMDGGTVCKRKYKRTEKHDG